MKARSALLASVALLGLAACQREAAEPAQAPAPPPAAAPSPPPAAAVSAPSTASATPSPSAAERRRKLREDKDGEAQTEPAPDYAGAAGAATSLPSAGDDARASGEPAQASPPPPPPGQPPG